MPVHESGAPSLCAGGAEGFARGRKGPTGLEKKPVRRRRTEAGRPVEEQATRPNAGWKQRGRRLGGPCRLCPWPSQAAGHVGELLGRWWLQPVQHAADGGNCWPSSKCRWNTFTLRSRARPFIFLHLHGMQPHCCCVMMLLPASRPAFRFCEGGRHSSTFSYRACGRFLRRALVVLEMTRHGKAAAFASGVRIGETPEPLRTP